MQPWAETRVERWGPLGSGRPGEVALTSVAAVAAVHAATCTLSSIVPGRPAGAPTNVSTDDTTSTVKVTTREIVDTIMDASFGKTASANAIVVYVATDAD